MDANVEVYDFLRSVCARFGIGFWEPGSGIIHQVVLENYAFPGGMMIGTDSHTPNAGGLGMVAVGVGGGDAIDVMTGSAFNLRWPRLIGVHLTGDAVRMGVAQGRDPRGGRIAHASAVAPARSSSTSARVPAPSARPARPRSATWAPRSAPPRRSSPTTPNTAAYLRATGRGATSPTAADDVADDLRADPEVRGRSRSVSSTRSSKSTCRRCDPMINGPDTPDLGHRVGEVGAWAREHDVPDRHLGRARRVVHQLLLRRHGPGRVRRPPERRARGLRAKTPLLVTPGSEQVRATVERDGLLADLESPSGRPCWPTPAGRASASGTARWSTRTSREHASSRSFNRNFARRNDGNAATKAFLASPEMVVAWPSRARSTSTPWST